VQAVGQLIVQYSLPSVIHIVPAAAEGNWKDLFLQQELSQSEVPVVKALHEGLGLVPVIEPVSVVVGPGEGVIVQRKLVAIDLDVIAVILFHQVHGHDIGHRHVRVCRRTKDVAGHHPPGHLQRLPVGVEKLDTKGRVHDSVGIAGGIGVQVCVVGAMIRAGAHPLPDGRIRAQDQIDIPSCTAACFMEKRTIMKNMGIKTNGLFTSSSSVNMNEAALTLSFILPNQWFHVKRFCHYSPGLYLPKTKPQAGKPGAKFY